MLFWGKRKENGVWMVSKRDYRFMLWGHDSLYIALGRFRLRLMKLGK